MRFERLGDTGKLIEHPPAVAVKKGDNLATGLRNSNIESPRLPAVGFGEMRMAGSNRCDQRDSPEPARCERLRR